MDLGKGKLRRNGVNSLVSALHERHGLVWSNGRCVFLSAVHVVDGEVENEESFRLGEFDFVHSLHWSSEMAVGMCYLCVVHQTTVSIWRVTGSSPDLTLKQVRKINAAPISQGVLWSPNRDVLCILNKTQASFYFRHSQNKGSFALPPIESGKITSGCWSMDGKRLLIGIGSIILLYLWDDIDKSISKFTIVAWKIPHVEGRVSTLVALSDRHMACTAELPLESLCHAASTDMFKVPELGPGPNSTDQNDLNGLENKGEVDTMRPSSDSDNTSHQDKLFNLHQHQGSMQACSQLIIFDIDNMSEPCKLSSANIKGMLAPDLICYDSVSQRLVVGSSNQSTVQVFHYSGEELAKVHDIRLRRDERPKGVGVMPGQSPMVPEGVFILVGRPQTTDTTFLPASNREVYDLGLHFYPFQLPAYEQCVSGGTLFNAVPLDPYTTAGLFKELQLPSGNAKVHLLRINPIHHEDKHSERGTESNSSSPASNSKWKTGKNGPQKVDLALPGEMGSLDAGGRRSGSGSGSGSSQGKIILLEGPGPNTNRELEVERVSFADHAPRFFNSLDALTSKTSDYKDDKDSDSKSSSGLTDHFPANIANKFGMDSLMGPSSYSMASYNWNGDISDSGKECREEMKMGLSCVQSDTLSGQLDFDYHDLPYQVATLETDIKTQGSQISKLQDRIDQISGILEDTSLVSSTQYQPASNPAVVYLVLQGQYGDPNIKKAFILDNSRLQLEPVKLAFGLITVELILDGVPCVVGANMDGYIPIKFMPNDVMHVTGRPASETLAREDRYSASTI